MSRFCRVNSREGKIMLIRGGSALSAHSASTRSAQLLARPFLKLSGRPMPRPWANPATIGGASFARSLSTCSPTTKTAPSPLPRKASLLQRITQACTISLHQAFPTLPRHMQSNVSVSVKSHTKAPLQCNSALRVSKLMKETPHDTATTLVRALASCPETNGLLVFSPESTKSGTSRTSGSSTATFQPTSTLSSSSSESTSTSQTLPGVTRATERGFVDLFLDDMTLESEVTRAATGIFHPPLPPPQRAESARVAIDFASPNMSKELHVGHLRSIVVGDCLSRVLEHCGHDVSRISHGGDFGTPMGLVIAQAFDVESPFVRAFLPDTATNDNDLVLDNKRHEPTLHDLSTLYAEAKSRSGDAVFMKAALRVCRILQESLTGIATNDSGDAVESQRIRTLWEVICRTSMRESQNLLSVLDVHVDSYNESKYAPDLNAVVEFLISRDIAVESDGAICIFLDGFKAPYLIRKGDGSYLYATTDCAALKYRLTEREHDWLIYITDVSQRIHFQQLFKVGSMAGWVDPNRHRLTHTMLGHVKKSDGRKLSSRDGTDTSHLLTTLLHEAVQGAGLLLSKSSEGGDVNGDDLIDDSTARRFGIGAVKYFELSQKRDQDYIYALDDVLSLKGNTSVYVNYAYVRCCAIERKSEESGTGASELDATEFAFSHQDTSTMRANDVQGVEKERALAFQISRFSDVVSDVERTLYPHHLCAYLYTLSSEFHGFYDQHKIVGSDRQKERLLLCRAVKQTIHKGMSLLGVSMVERM